MLFSLIIAHGAVPDSFLRSSFVSIPKGKHGTASESTNFHGITLSYIYGKLSFSITKFYTGMVIVYPRQGCSLVSNQKAHTIYALGIGNQFHIVHGINRRFSVFFFYTPRRLSIE